MLSAETFTANIGKAEVERRGDFQNLPSSCPYVFKIASAFYLGLARERVNAVDIATRYGLDGPGIESRWGEIFRTPPDRPCGPPGSFPGVKRPGRGVNHPPPSIAEVKGRNEQYLCSPSVLSWQVIGWTLPFMSSCLRVIYFVKMF
jgi:hypothetical protein